MKPTTLNLPKRIIQKLDDVAAREQRSRSALVRIVFENWLKNPVTAPIARQALGSQEFSGKQEPPA
ncbi:MAG: ribbon-helix-helix protein, CopG family [Gammaproteobacteria bacterium]